MDDSVARRLRPFGTTIFTEMSALAQRTGALNLGQGFPDEDGPAELVEAAAAAMRAGRNQYAPLAGVPELRRAVAAHQRRRYGLEVDPDAGVQVTFGATEAIAAALLGLLEPGEAVVALEPTYDSYGAAVAMAGGILRPVTLHAPEFALDLERLEAAAAGARILLLNTPHNPTGRVLTQAELEGVARICREHDLIAITDEVYEQLVYDDAVHVPLATLPGMAERTLTISSAGKAFSFTGWKIGWCSGPPRLVAAARAAKQFMTFAGGTPLQHAVAHGLDHAERLTTPLAAQLQANRDALADGLTSAGFALSRRSAGTYFLNADAAPLGVTDAAAWCRELPHRAGVVAIPASAFHASPDSAPTLVRFAFCKSPQTIAAAVERLQRLRGAG
ncbi:aminotransferase class I/II-fold pyridoxal phosphate-dependent enzyme [Conexibacter sp. JD483]|uniref:aminotransferase class I/II-fold pyridoxal phosphate-dependent enzyme n=1 Tax=unclassified Conexibacter TaxID=2627773 RepID=UPI002724FEBE|nr:MULTISPECIES: aminotransferase class I/II-fold pyridoxal phosphate-dependent enzyme [unclassified Conexibacter]MDO8185287.1 aminotransferase class I/II-fold pyridoxal phosphate-dependent enzyme [Conexibacter sp. CPCC 205706]MDO8198333.1 aminotransferase class I/II-fold pyridoxal phosphate-dependent enzyme [Conexibacter sp. CPCC 205762]MDR9370520.1 aminotransferase class I/II-fold pyridoxal phosphate-dependent enzyme [Conexibacter sp. JD483]